MMLIYGYLVIENRMVQEHVPKFSLKPGDYVSEQVRKEFDDWLAKTFGYNPCFIISEAQKMLFVHPNNMYILDRAINQPNENFPVSRMGWPESLMHHVLNPKVTIIKIGCTEHDFCASRN